MERPIKKNYIDKKTKVELIADLEMYIEYLETLNKQLKILSISNQRELLIAFYKKMLNNMHKGYANETIEKHVDVFLKNK